MTPVVMQRQVLGVDSAENCGSSTVAVLGQGCGHACCCAQDTAEARGDSTGAVLGQVVTCPLL